jgi:Skp family chaperone for outer membrane proteins
MKLFKGMENLFNKADNTEKRYEEALERKQAELVELQGNLQDQNFMLKDMHKMKLLGDVSEATYEAEAEKVQKLQKQVQELQKEVQLIEAYKTEDVKQVIEELDAERIKVNKKHQGELNKLQLELLQAKQDYLNKMLEAREKYNQLIEPTKKLDEMKIKLGLKSMSYVSDSFEALVQHSVPSGGYESVRVEQGEVHDALRCGRTPERLNKIITEAKEKGILEN